MSQSITNSLLQLAGALRMGSLYQTPITQNRPISMGIFGGIPCMNSFDANVMNTIMGWNDCTFERQRINMQMANIFSGTPQNLPNNINQQQAPNLINFAECFNKLKAETLSRLQEIEKTLKEKNQAYDKAKAEKNSEQRKALAKEISALQEEYKTLEKSFSPSAQPSKTYGKEFNFYSNLAKSELDTIEEKNTEIQNMQEQLKRLEQEVMNKKSAIAQRMQQLQTFGINPYSVNTQISVEEQEAIRAQEKEMSDLANSIVAKNQDLRNYIKKAGQSTDEVDFYVSKLETGRETAKTAKTEAETKAEQEVQVAGFDANGKALNADAAKAAIQDALKKIPDSGLSEDAIKETATFIAQKIQGKTYEELKKYLASSEFYQDIKDKDNCISALERYTDAVLGEKGSFKTHAINAIASDIGTLGSLQAKISKSDAYNTYSLDQTIAIYKANNNNAIAKGLTEGSLKELKNAIERATGKDQEYWQNLKTRMNNYKETLGNDTEIKKAYDALMETINNKINNVNNGSSTVTDSNKSSTSQTPTKDEKAKLEEFIKQNTKNGNLDFNSLLNHINNDTDLSVASKIKMLNEVRKKTNDTKVQQNIEKQLLGLEMKQISDNDLVNTAVVLCHSLGNADYINNLSDAMLVKLLSDETYSAQISNALFAGTNSEHKEAFAAFVRRINNISRKIGYDKELYIASVWLGKCLKVRSHQNAAKEELWKISEYTSTDDIYDSITCWWWDDWFDKVPELARKIDKYTKEPLPINQ